MNSAHTPLPSISKFAKELYEPVTVPGNPMIEASF